MSGIDVRAAVGLTGRVTLLLIVPLLLPMAAALYYGEPVLPFLTAIAVAVAIGGGLLAVGRDRDIGTREGLFMVTVTWLVVAAIGAVPYLIAAHGEPGVVAPQTPTSTLGSPVNALFESMSGFTTTGATVLGVIDPAVHGRAMLLWRQLTQWLGGMGIVVLAVAILPRLSVGGAQLMETEAPGPGIEKLKPHIAATARTLWTIYIALTALEVALLVLVGQLGARPGDDAVQRAGAWADDDADRGVLPCGALDRGVRDGHPAGDHPVHVHRRDELRAAVAPAAA